MDRRAFGFGAAASLALAGCSGGGAGVSRFQIYDGPEVTSIVVNKGARKMYLLHHEEVLKQYDVDLGFAPLGTKSIEGDGRTPEGTYLIDRRNPNSRYHLSVGISYPNQQDREAALAMGRKPGGDIFIHGEPVNARERKRAARVDDWTAGCIAVSNEEIEEIYAMVQDGTTITLRP
ncbi:L,D-transpeptidase family protein [Cribrihabitans pelagius]|uniref:L,D-transpeptidase family protein n=1 Tax=Cribrihabitans pelagius TaxID=1765746 RepID=UPI003B5BAF86